MSLVGYRKLVNMDYLPDPDISPLGSTICPRSSDPSYAVTYCIKWVTTSWTHSTAVLNSFIQ